MVSASPVQTGATQTAARRTGAEFYAVTLGGGILSTLYNITVIERREHIIFSQVAFLQAEPLTVWGRVAFALLCPAELLLFVITLASIARWALRPVLGKRSWIAGGIIVVAHAVLVTIQNRVLQYVRDGFNLAVARELAGGHLRDAFGYVAAEAIALLPLIGLTILIAVVIAWLLHRRAFGALVDLAFARFAPLFLWKTLGRLNLGFFCLLPLVALMAPRLDWALGLDVTHNVYMAPARYLSDFDRDGYGLFDRPPDFAPFDSSRHPYALDIPGNGIDEDGIGGDLPALLPHIAPERWDASQLRRDSVVLIVVESARAGLLDADVNGVPVMPALRDVSGHRFALFSHRGYTTPSIEALMNGTIFNDEAIPLIDRFRSLGYSTAVVSAQDEDFGGGAAATRLREAGLFLDARDFKPTERMYVSTEPGALSVPWRVVNERVRQWLPTVNPQRPFFLYLNWQELHFPYYYRGEPLTLLHDPLPREAIDPSNRERLRATYWNGARSVDNAFADLLALLKSQNRFRNTVLVVVGDHGEELFDHGYLGHGTNISFEQNQAIGKLINSPWTPPPVPVGSADISRLIHNALARPDADLLPLPGVVLCHSGDIHRPRQIAEMTPAGMVKYDFLRDRWTMQKKLGAPEIASGAQNEVIHLWESELVREAMRLHRITLR